MFEEIILHTISMRERKRARDRERERVVAQNKGIKKHTNNRGNNLECIMLCELQIRAGI